MASQIDIVNLALTHLGCRLIASMQENSEAARRAGVVWGPAVDEVLREHAWNFSTIIQPLALAANDTVMGWSYVYAYPAKCLKVRRVLNQAIFDNISSDPTGDDMDFWGRMRTRAQDFREMIGPTTGNQILVSQLSSAYAEFTYAMYDVSRWDSQFVKAMSFKLAAELAPHLTGKEDRAAAMEAKCKDQISDAKRIDLSEGQDKARASSVFVESRT
jgi:hypothetical protein